MGFLSIVISLLVIALLAWLVYYVYTKSGSGSNSPNKSASGSGNSRPVAQAQGSASSGAANSAAPANPLAGTSPRRPAPLRKPWEPLDYYPGNHGGSSSDIPDWRYEYHHDGSKVDGGMHDHDMMGPRTGRGVNLSAYDEAEPNAEQLRQAGEKMDSYQRASFLRPLGAEDEMEEYGADFEPSRDQYIQAIGAERAIMRPNGSMVKRIAQEFGLNTMLQPAPLVLSNVNPNDGLLPFGRNDMLATPPDLNRPEQLLPNGAPVTLGDRIIVTQDF